MKTWFFSECPYPDLPDPESYDSIRVSLPNSLYDPRRGAELYDVYLDLWQAADELGLNIMTNEHHQTATCLVPAVPLLASILARTTQNARILILGNPIANRRDPLRVAEEMALIDNLSKGRLEVGFVRGVPFEVLPANSRPTGMHDRMWEAHDLILKAWETHDGPFSWEGNWHYRHVNIWPRPYQQPRPPVWVTGTSLTSVPEIARHGHTMAAFVTGPTVARGLFDEYRRVYAESHGGATAPDDRLGYGVQVFVADTEAAAREGALKLRWYFDANKVPPHLANPPGYSPPKRAAAAGSAAAPVPQARQAKGQSFEWMTENGVLFAGTPDQVVEQIASFHAAVGGFGHVLMMGHAGPMEYAETVRSLELYATEVQPRLHELGVAVAQ
ncbi:MAG TPA: LLM class flavin-dependent oxidoreductase [Nocardioides sp.]|uniref:LLM class flavin-dependent oxidoreductase n=1 Tax=uncultured Nocardioides sp. TaxID=198441 RepID=UPI000ECB7B0D|nr:LLM class flavin-dependent oxidoreductase [uncultured Nocardioides sp.]HCB05112.1 LLM class flavin-dependent oxidoreductase [Nocardioides sp.]HRD59971.1 LLM class flavin-dependent oxidoreductase [Nocardioides sp.]HRI94145.1 LLM class flavin-dependent oxidoreductase [Nocardioides sp.]HRK44191.1 LLM class flavin-dependent oxidoreductase [Nocardioides sp.]